MCVILSIEVALGRSDFNANNPSGCAIKRRYQKGWYFDKPKKFFTSGLEFRVLGTKESYI